MHYIQVPQDVHCTAAAYTGIYLYRFHSMFTVLQQHTQEYIYTGSTVCSLYCSSIHRNIFIQVPQYVHCTAAAYTGRKPKSKRVSQVGSVVYWSLCAPHTHNFPSSIPSGDTLVLFYTFLRIATRTILSSLQLWLCALTA